MDAVTIYLIIFSALVLMAGYFLTIKITKSQPSKGIDDESVPNQARRHSLLVNPVFIVYIVAGVLTAGLIIYWIVLT